MISKSEKLLKHRDINMMYTYLEYFRHRTYTFFFPLLQTFCKTKMFSFSVNPKMGFSIIFLTKTNSGFYVISNLFLLKVKLKSFERYFPLYSYDVHALFTGSFRNYYFIMD